MKRALICLLHFVLIISMIGCSNAKKKDIEPSGKFILNKGLNASHWLSQSEKRGEERDAYMTDKDFALISEMGFDHVRLPIDEMQMWTVDGEKIDAAFKLMHRAINSCIKHDLRVIVDLHVLRSHHFNAPNEEGRNANTLFNSKEAQEDFIQYWKDLSAELKKYPNRMVAYEPMNEAVAEDHEDWNKLINWVIAEIRKLEPERTVIMGSNMWQQPGTFPYLKIPENDTNIILSFHTYTPMPFTHYKAAWNPMRTYNGPVYYPGIIVDTNDLKGLDIAATNEILKSYGNYSRESLEKEIIPAIEVAKKNGLQLYCGEFGCYPTTPIEMRVQWYADMIAIFEKNDIAWAHWNYKNDFPVVDSNLNPISELVDVLVKKY